MGFQHGIGGLHYPPLSGFSNSYTVPFNKFQKGKLHTHLEVLAAISGACGIVLHARALKAGADLGIFSEEFQGFLIMNVHFQFHSIFT